MFRIARAFYESGAHGRHIHISLSRAVKPPKVLPLGAMLVFLDEGFDPDAGVRINHKTGNGESDAIGNAAGFVIEAGKPFA